MAETRHRLSDLVFDDDIYPRVAYDSRHVTMMVAAEEAGVTFPPIVIDGPTRTIIDGVHRWHKDRRVHGEDYEMPCIERTFANKGEMLLEALRLNAAHGKPLSAFDRARAALKAKRFRCSLKLVAKSIGMTPEMLRAIGEGRTARVSPGAGESSGGEAALKRTIMHLRGKEITPAQEEVNKKLCGQDQAFLLHQIVLLLENDLFDWDDSRVTGLLDRVVELATARLASGRVV